MIKKYVEITGTIDAIKYTGKNLQEVTDFVGPEYEVSFSKNYNRDTVGFENKASFFFIFEGDYVVKRKDVYITGINGEHFESNYMAISEQEPVVKETDYRAKCAELVANNEFIKKIATKGIYYSKSLEFADVGIFVGRRLIEYEVFYDNFVPATVEDWKASLFKR